MVEPTNSLLYEVLKQVQAGQAAMQGALAELSAKVDTMDRKIGLLAEGFTHFRNDLRMVRDDVHQLRVDGQIMVIAIDEIGHRVDALEGNPRPQV